jgi:hypothetical protein
VVFPQGGEASAEVLSFVLQIGLSIRELLAEDVGVRVEGVEPTVFTTAVLFQPLNFQLEVGLTIGLRLFQALSEFFHLRH